MKEKGIPAISNIRILSAFLILISHYMQGSQNPGLMKISFISVYGICMFMFISGYLSNKDKNSKFIYFWIKRYIRIMIPVYIYFIFMYIVEFIQTGKINIANSFLNILMGLFAFVPIQGASHLWFVTILLICVILTPVLFWLKRVTKYFSPWVIVFITFLLILLEGFIFLNKVDWIYLEYLLSIFMYCLGFFYKDFLKNRRITFNHCIVLFILGSLTLILKYKLLSLGTILFAHYAMIFNFFFTSMFLMGMVYLISKKDLPIYAMFIDKIAYSLYIFHPLVLFGPVLIIYYTASISNFIESLIVILIGSILLEKTSKYVISLLNFRTRKSA